MHIFFPVIGFLFGLSLVVGSVMNVKAIVDPPKWNLLLYRPLLKAIFEVEGMRTVTGAFGISMMLIAVLFYVFV